MNMRTNEGPASHRPTPNRPRHDENRSDGPGKLVDRADEQAGERGRRDLSEESERMRSLLEDQTASSESTDDLAAMNDAEGGDSSELTMMPSHLADQLAANSEALRRKIAAEAEGLAEISDGTAELSDGTAEVSDGTKAQLAQAFSKNQAESTATQKATTGGAAESASKPSSGGLSQQGAAPSSDLAGRPQMGSSADAEFQARSDLAASLTSSDSASGESQGSALDASSTPNVIPTSPGDAILQGMRPVGESQPAASAPHLDVFREVADRILVSDAALSGEQEVRVTIKDSILPGTELRVGQEGGQLVVRLITESDQSFRLLTQHQDTLQTYLRDRLDNSGITVDLSMESDTQGRSRNRQEFFGTGEDETE